MTDIIRVEIRADYEKPASAGNYPNFNVCNAIGYFSSSKVVDLTSLIDQENFYSDKYEVLEDLIKICSNYNFSCCEIEIV